MTTAEIQTPHGPALAHVHPAAEPAAALVLGHGAGGGFGAPDLIATKDVALALGLSVVFVEQPYRVAGRRSAAPARQLDTAWIAVVEHLRAGQLRGLALVSGGRSSGARVACRTAAATGAVAVLCLAFPLCPPRRAGGAQPPSRLPELEAVTVPVLVVQGEGDPFGMPAPDAGREVVRVRGNHSLRSDVPALRTAIEQWLPSVLAASTSAATSP